MHHHARITRKGHDIAYVQIPLGGPDHTVEVPGLRQVRGLYVVRSGPYPCSGIGHLRSFFIENVLDKCKCGGKLQR